MSAIPAIELRNTARRLTRGKGMVTSDIVQACRNGAAEIDRLQAELDAALAAAGTPPPPEPDVDRWEEVPVEDLQEGDELANRGPVVYTEPYTSRAGDGTNVCYGRVLCQVIGLPAGKTIVRKAPTSTTHPDFDGIDDQAPCEQCGDPQRCCPSHRWHVTPHRGCMLR